MRFTEIVKVDSKGRVTIPLVVREALNVIEGMNLILIADTDRREIILTPLPGGGENLYELRIEFKDVPGALARISSKLAELDVDQVATQCTTVKRGENAECIIIIDLSKSTRSIDEIKSELSAMEDVHFVQIKQLQHR
ncbi:AbrB/MazE/SpoVT family DNA-binding domain-containing protein [Hyperthermus butylicus]|uniref:Acetolactate synthase, small (Regulatory) subunit n=1 Tax=Hyperthermus butylicus (strain DSM 5456 / JCM 9403 / PLM1-5) TaxID=415426 RepID=A2BMA4_HYPBU|nr:AbrB family transcriptional regulator [Hyperthermus butylicus]ABM81115.1 Acetolactate synthase, small (regulatory) subunit [Hyperthermus butylicus DSM 5456]